MSKKPLRIRFAHRKIIAALHRAIDQTYRQLLATTKADWERLFAGRDRNDDSADVRFSDAETAEELSGVPRAGALPARAKPVNGKIRRRIA